MYDFDRDTQLTQNGTHFAGTLSPAWNIGDNPNGGYMVACAMQAIAKLLPHADPMTITTHFLRPGLGGEPFEVNVTVIREGRTSSIARAELSQQGKSRIEILCAFCDLSSSVGVDTNITIPAIELPPPEQCPLRSGETQGIHLPILDRLEVRLHPEQAKAGTYPSAEVSGWIKFPDGRDPDTLSLPVFADAFPPSPFAMLGVVGWVPTLELTVHVRRKPVPGWIKAQLITQDLDHGRMVESGLLWDSEGNLVAQSRQLGLVMNQN